MGEGVERLLPREREHRSLERREPRVQPENAAALPADLVLVVGGEEEGHHRPRRAGRRLDDVRRVALAGHLVEVLERPPEAALWALRSKSVRLAIPSSSPSPRGRGTRCRSWLSSSGRGPPGRAGGTGGGPRGSRARRTRRAVPRTSRRTSGRRRRAGRRTPAPSSRTRGCGTRSSPGVISLRKHPSSWAIPKGGLRRIVVITFAKLTNIPCAVSGRR